MCIAGKIKRGSRERVSGHYISLPELLSIITKSQTAAVPLVYPMLNPVQKSFFLGSGHTELLAVAHGHIPAVTAAVMLHMHEIDEIRLMNSKKRGIVFYHGMKVF